MNRCLGYVEGTMNRTITQANDNRQLTISIFKLIFPHNYKSPLSSNAQSETSKFPEYLLLYSNSWANHNWGLIGVSP